MKTLTITLHSSLNCGSSLQTFALQSFLKNNNIENLVVDYRPSYHHSFVWNSKQMLKKIIYFKAINSQQNKFKEFTDQHISLTQKVFFNYQQLVNEKFMCDCFITGSDQLWNGMYDCGRDDAYYLSFFKGKKIAYSVSVGRKNIPEADIDRITSRCGDFSWVSFRESSSVPIFKDILPFPVDFACDPTLLLRREDYEEISSPRLIQDKYVFIYLAQEVDKVELSDVLYKLKEKLPESKIIFSGTYHRRCFCDYHLRDISPGEFISAIKNAEYVICNSFHASVFSLIFQKSFTTLLPNENGERILALLNEVNLRYKTIQNHVEVDLGVDDLAPLDSAIDLLRKQSGAALIERIAK